MNDDNRQSTPDNERLALIEQFEALREAVAAGDLESVIMWLDAALTRLEGEK